jgi:FixJ family two-component response regulator
MCPAFAPTDERPLIVVLDADEALRQALRFSLETEGYRVRTFGAARDLLACLQDLDADCFVIDEAGCDPGLGQWLGARRAPVIWLSGRSGASGRGDGVVVVEKPLLTDALSRRIAAALATV